MFVYLQLIRKLAVAAMGLLLVSMAAAQSYRVSYAYYYKTEPDADGYRAEMDMRLDVTEGKAVFYSENRFLKDSLWTMTFDEQGNIKDDYHYNLLQSMPIGCMEIAFMDYSGEKFTQSFNYPTMMINGSSVLKMPYWKLTDDVKISKEGYNVRKAITEYMGREWSVWYTEDIPLPYGPWVLWGTPGLVIMAEDSESLFQFRYMGIEEIEDSERYSVLWDYYHSYSSIFRVYDLGLIEAISMYTNLRTDSNYQRQMTGASNFYIVDRNGKRTEVDGFPYIPLVPLSYKTK